MPWTGGIYTRTNGFNTGPTVWSQDLGQGVKIVTDRHDAHDQDLATGLNNCVTKDGLNKPAANLTPAADASYSVGTAVARWTDAFFSGSLTFGASGSFSLTLSVPTLTASRAVTFPDQAGQVVVGPFAAHAVMVGTGATVPTVLGTGTAGQVLTSNGASADPTFQSVAAPSIPSGTVMPFLQAAAPSGWTQVASFNDAVIRLVGSGEGAGTGGSWVISGLTDGGVVLTSAQSGMPAHSHGVTDPTHNHSYTLSGSGSSGTAGIQTSGNYAVNGASWPTTFSGTGITINNAAALNASAPHNHGVFSNGSWRPSYVDAIVCSKN